jgi:hypothetical protein
MRPFHFSLAGLALPHPRASCCSVCSIAVESDHSRSSAGLQRTYIVWALLVCPTTEAVSYKCCSFSDLWNWSHHHHPSGIALSPGRLFGAFLWGCQSRLPAAPPVRTSFAEHCRLTSYDDPILGFGCCQHTPVARAELETSPNPPPPNLTSPTLIGHSEYDVALLLSGVAHHYCRWLLWICVTLYQVWLVSSYPYICYFSRKF